ncbi:amino acid ABC transporter ATP-binding protein [Acidisoma silvae]|nr:amino acid ABC transporter ATP-binding protein [Acidisoma silvae]
MNADRPMVRIDDLWLSRGVNAILKGVSLTVARGSVTALLGPSGAGKSTLLRCVNALETYDRGLIHVDDLLIGCEKRGDQYFRLGERVLSRQRAEIGMVFQSFNLFPHMTVLENIIGAPIRVRGQGRAEAIAHARDLLRKVGLSEKEHAFPKQLSGGQQQRIAIARSLAMRPKLMLFDEPTSALDPHLVGEVLHVIRDLAKGGMTMMIVTHEVQFAREVADRVAVMVDGQIAECGPAAAVLSNPQDARVRAFLSRTLRPDA